MQKSPLDNLATSAMGKIPPAPSTLPQSKSADFLVYSTKDYLHGKVHRSPPRQNVQIPVLEAVNCCVTSALPA